MTKFDKIQTEIDTLDAFLDGQFGADVDEAFSASQSITKMLQELSQEELDDEFKE